jgi:hypothetical protein
MKKKLPIAPVRSNVRGTCAVQAISIEATAPGAMGSVSGTDTTSRHHTIRSTVDWSYQLLSPQEQHVFVGTLAENLRLAFDAAYWGSLGIAVASPPSKISVPRHWRGFVL